MNDNTYVLDRIEGPIAVLIDAHGGIREIPAAHLPQGCREGAVLRQLDGCLLPDPEAEAERRAAMEARLARLLQKNK